MDKGKRNSFLEKARTVRGSLEEANMAKPKSSASVNAGTPLSQRISPLLTLQQVAHATAFSVRQVRRWIEAGELRACRMNRAVRVTEADLALFITSKMHR